MELQNFIELFAEQFDETPMTEFAPETKYRELDEWSSLIALSVIAMVDEEFDVTLKGDDIKNAGTLENLFNLIQSKL